MLTWRPLPAVPMPALLIRVSSRSVVPCTAAARLRTPARLARSALKNVAAPPTFSISATACAPLAASRPCTRTRTPFSPSRRATTRPTPSVDPVTSTVLSVNFSERGLLLWRHTQSASDLVRASRFDRRHPTVSQRRSPIICGVSVQALPLEPEPRFPRPRSHARAAPPYHAH